MMVKVIMKNSQDSINIVKGGIIIDLIGCPGQRKVN